MSRRILVVAHPGRKQSMGALDEALKALAALGTEPVTEYIHGVSEPVEAALVLGGDGTMLHAVALTHGSDVPLLGVNFGRVGFLAEAERDDVDVAAEALATGNYTVEERRTLDLTVTRPDGSTSEGWALNEATVERAYPRRTLEIVVEVDGRTLSTFGCDGVVVATPTGSTAHAFSAGGPILWPDVNALIFVPLAAHALFSRPLVVGPNSTFGIRVAATSSTPGTVVCDGARAIDVPLEGRVDYRQGKHTVRLARLTDDPFSERLIVKFSLPTKGWRGELDSGTVGV
jgi:NAD+ kinase